MKIVLVLLRKDFARLRRDKASLSLTFLVPLALIYLFGLIFGVNRKDPGPTGLPLAVVNLSDEPAAQRLLAALRAAPSLRVVAEHANPDGSRRPLVEADLEPLLRNGDCRFALVIPRDLIREDALGLHLKILSNPRNEIETQTMDGLLQKTIFSHVPELLGQALQARARTFLGADRLDGFNAAIADNIARTFGGDRDRIRERIRSGQFGFDAIGQGSGPAGAAGGEDLFSRLVRLERTQVVGKDVKSPAATRIVGGWAMQFLLFALSASANALFQEREQGLLTRLLSTPASRAHILWSKFLYGVLLGLLQLLVLFTAGRILYGIDVEHHLPLLALVCVFAAGACTAFGMLLAAVVPTPEAARGLATLLILLMSAIGGAWFPTSFMPEVVQHFSKLTLVYWSMEGFQQVLWANASLAEVLPTLGVLGGITAAVMAFALWRFNRGRIFD